MIKRLLRLEDGPPPAEPPAPTPRWTPTRHVCLQCGGETSAAGTICGPCTNANAEEAANRDAGGVTDLAAWDRRLRNNAMRGERRRGDSSVARAALANLSPTHRRILAALRMHGPGPEVDAALAECDDAECNVCSAIICPHGDELHFHHDGCPSCAERGTSEGALRHSHPRPGDAERPDVRGVPVEHTRDAPRALTAPRAGWCRDEPEVRPVRHRTRRRS